MIDSLLEKAAKGAAGMAAGAEKAAAALEAKRKREEEERRRKEEERLAALAAKKQAEQEAAAQAERAAAAQRAQEAAQQQAMRQNQAQSRLDPWQEEAARLRERRAERDNEAQQRFQPPEPLNQEQFAEYRRRTDREERDEQRRLRQMGPQQGPMENPVTRYEPSAQRFDPDNRFRDDRDVTGVTREANWLFRFREQQEREDYTPRVRPERGERPETPDPFAREERENLWKRFWSGTTGLDGSERVAEEARKVYPQTPLTPDELHGADITGFSRDYPGHNFESTYGDWVTVETEGVRFSGPQMQEDPNWRPLTERVQQGIVDFASSEPYQDPDAQDIDTGFDIRVPVEAQRQAVWEMTEYWKGDRESEIVARGKTPYAVFGIPFLDDMPLPPSAFSIVPAVSQAILSGDPAKFFEAFQPGSLTLREAAEGYVDFGDILTAGSHIVGVTPTPFTFGNEQVREGDLNIGMALSVVFESLTDLAKQEAIFRQQVEAETGQAPSWIFNPFERSDTPLVNRFLAAGGLYTPAYMEGLVKQYPQLQDEIETLATAEETFARNAWVARLAVTPTATQLLNNTPGEIMQAVAWARVAAAASSDSGAAVLDTMLDREQNTQYHTEMASVYGNLARQAIPGTPEHSHYMAMMAEHGYQAKTAADQHPASVMAKHANNFQLAALYVLADPLNLIDPAIQAVKLGALARRFRTLNRTLASTPEQALRMAGDELAKPVSRFFRPGSTSWGAASMGDNPVMQVVQDVMQTARSKGIEDANRNFMAIANITAIADNAEDAATLVRQYATDPRPLISGMDASQFKSLNMLRMADSDGKIRFGFQVIGNRKTLDAQKSARLVADRILSLPSVAKGGPFNKAEFAAEVHTLLMQGGFERFDIAKAKGLPVGAAKVRAVDGYSTVAGHHKVVEYLDSKGNVLSTSLPMDASEAMRAVAGANKVLSKKGVDLAEENMLRNIASWRRNIMSTIHLNIPLGAGVTNAMGSNAMAFITGSHSWTSLAEHTNYVAAKMGNVSPTARIAQLEGTAGQYAGGFMSGLRNLRSGQTEIPLGPGTSFKYGEEANAKGIFGTTFRKYFESDWGGRQSRNYIANSFVEAGITDEAWIKRTTAAVIEAGKRGTLEDVIDTYTKAINGQTRTWSMADVNPAYYDVLSQEGHGRIARLMERIGPDNVADTVRELRQIEAEEIKRMGADLLEYPSAPGRIEFSALANHQDIADEKRVLKALEGMGVVDPQESAAITAAQRAALSQVYGEMKGLGQVAASGQPGAHMHLYDAWWQIQLDRTNIRQQLYELAENAQQNKALTPAANAAWREYADLSKTLWTDHATKAESILEEARSKIAAGTPADEGMNRWSSIDELLKLDDEELDAAVAAGANEGRTIQQRRQAIEAANAIKDKASLAAYMAARRYPDADTIDHLVSAQRQIDEYGAAYAVAKADAYDEFIRSKLNDGKTVTQKDWKKYTKEVNDLAADLLSATVARWQTATIDITREGLGTRLVARMTFDHPQIGQVQLIKPIQGKNGFWLVRDSGGGLHQLPGQDIAKTYKWGGPVVPKEIEVRYANLEAEIEKSLPGEVQTISQTAEAQSATRVEEARTRAQEALAALAAEESTVAPTPFKRGDQAVWRINDTDQPVVIRDMIGERNGERYYRIAGSRTGVPESQLRPVQPSLLDEPAPISLAGGEGDIARQQQPLQALTKWEIIDAYRDQLPPLEQVPGGSYASLTKRQLLDMVTQGGARSGPLPPTPLAHQRSAGQVPQPSPMQRQLEEMRQLRPTVPVALDGRLGTQGANAFIAYLNSVRQATGSRRIPDSINMRWALSFVNKHMPEDMKNVRSLANLRAEDLPAIYREIESVALRELKPGEAVQGLIVQHDEYGTGILDTRGIVGKDGVQRWYVEFEKPDGGTQRRSVAESRLIRAEGVDDVLAMSEADLSALVRAADEAMRNAQPGTAPAKMRASNIANMAVQEALTGAADMASEAHRMHIGRKEANNAAHTTQADRVNYMREMTAHAFDDIVRHAQRLAGEGQVANMPPGLPPGKGMAAIGNFVGNIKPRWDNAVYKATRMGEEAVSIGVLDYTREYHPDVLLGMFMPYHFFFSRSMKNNVELLMSHPLMYAKLAQMDRIADIENEQTNQPLRNQGTLPGLQIGDTEWRVRSPVEKWIPNLRNVFAFSWGEPEAANNMFSLVVEGARHAGFGPYPEYAWASQMVMSGQDLDGTYQREIGMQDIGGLGGATLGWAALAATGETTPILQPSYTPYLIAREIPNMVRRGELTEFEGLIALDYAYMQYSGADPLPGITQAQYKSAESVYVQAGKKVGTQYAMKSGISFLTGVNLAPIQQEEIDLIQARATYMRTVYSQDNPFGSMEAAVQLFDEEPGLASRMALSSVRNVQAQIDGAGDPEFTRPGARAMRTVLFDRLSAINQRIANAELQAVNQLFAENPQATPSEFNAARQEASAELQKQKDAIQSQLDALPVAPSSSSWGRHPDELINKQVQDAFWAAVTFGGTRPPSPPENMTKSQRKAYNKLWAIHNKVQETLFVSMVQEWPGMEGELPAGKPLFERDDAVRLFHRLQIENDERRRTDFEIDAEIRQDALFAQLDINDATAQAAAKERKLEKQLLAYWDAPASERPALLDSDPRYRAALMAAFDTEEFDFIEDNFGKGAVVEYYRNRAKEPQHPGDDATDAQMEAYWRAQDKFSVANPQHEMVGLYIAGRPKWWTRDSTWVDEEGKSLWRPDYGQDYVIAMQHNEDMESATGMSIWEYEVARNAASLNGTFLDFRDRNWTAEGIYQGYRQWYYQFSDKPEDPAALQEQAEYANALRLELLAEDEIDTSIEEARIRAEREEIMGSPVEMPYGELPGGVDTYTAEQQRQARMGFVPPATAGINEPTPEEELSPMQRAIRSAQAPEVEPRTRQGIMEQLFGTANREEIEARQAAGATSPLQEITGGTEPVLAGEESAKAAESTLAQFEAGSTKGGIAALEPDYNLYEWSEQNKTWQVSKAKGEEYRARRQSVYNQFGTSIGGLYDQYMNLSKGEARQKFKQEHPELRAVSIFTWHPTEYAEIEEMFGEGAMLTWARTPAWADTDKARAARNQYYDAHPEAFLVNAWIHGRPANFEGEVDDDTNFEYNFGQDYAQARELFGADIWDVVSGWKRGWNTDERRAYYEQYPQLRDFWDWWYGNEGDAQRNGSGTWRAWSSGGWGGGGGGSWEPAEELPRPAFINQVWAERNQTRRWRPGVSDAGGNEWREFREMVGPRRPNTNPR